MRGVPAVYELGNQIGQIIEGGLENIDEAFLKSALHVFGIARAFPSTAAERIVEGSIDMYESMEEGEMPNPAKLLTGTRAEQ